MGWKVLAIAAALAVAGIVPDPAEAQRLRGAGPPAEVPPPSYEGRQYVDSRGCVYVRAGFEGAESWVPRVGRNRQQICGAQPTLSPAQQATAAPIVEPAPAPAPAPASPPPPARTAAAPPAAVAVPAAREPAAAVRTPPSAPVGTLQRPAAAVTVRPALAVPAPVLVAGAGNCPNLSAVGSAYSLPGARCGPEAESPYGNPVGAGPAVPDILVGDERLAADGTIRRVTAGTVVAETSRGPVTVRVGAQRALAGARAVRIPGGLVVPRLVARPAPIVPVAIPEGYRAVTFDDDRLNPLRGPRSIAGSFATQLVWTNTTPRRLRSPLRSGQVTEGYRRVLVGR